MNYMNNELYELRMYFTHITVMYQCQAFFIERCSLLIYNCIQNKQHAKNIENADKDKTGSMLKQ